MGTFILIAVIVITACLGRYAVAEGQRIERQKKFKKQLWKWQHKYLE